MQILSIIITAILSGSFVSLLNFLFNARTMRKKENATVRGQELDNIEKAVTIWRNLNKELQEKVELQGKDIEVLKKSNCRKENCENRIL